MPTARSDAAPARPVNELQEINAEKRETLADVVASMRRGTKLPGYWRSCDLNRILAYHANRIEKAAKREREAVEADALALGGLVEAERQRADVSKTETTIAGNAAAMREALVAIRDAARNFCHQILNSKYNDIMDEYKCRERGFPALIDLRYNAIPKANAALAAPPRNCDVGTPEEQKERFDAFCDAQPRMRYSCDCNLQKNRQGLCEGLCEFAWAQTPYESDEQETP